MKTLSRLSLLSLAAALSATSASAATDAFKAQFNDFVGHYEVVSCSGRIRSGTDTQDKVNQYCDRKYVHIFLGDSYVEKADGDIYFYNMSDCLQEPTDGPSLKKCNWVGSDVGADPASIDKGDQAFATYGTEIQIGNDEGGGKFIDQSTISVANGLTYLHHNVTVPQAGKNFLYNDVVLVMKKLD